MMKPLHVPIPETTVRNLRAGDAVSLSGTIVTARDAAHKYWMEGGGEEVRAVLQGGVIYHCGPVVRKEGERYTFVAAGPTTSIREEPYEAEIIRRFGVRAVIGKGGMGPKTLAACKESGCVYLSAIGGLATILAASVKEVRDVHKLSEFGVPEAMWVIEVEDFPAMVTMDTHGVSLHEEVLAASEKKYAEILERT